MIFSYLTGHYLYLKDYNGPWRKKTCLWGFRPSQSYICLVTETSYNIETLHAAIILYREQITMALIRLCIWAVWSAPLLFASNKVRFGYLRFGQKFSFVRFTFHVMKVYQNLTGTCYTKGKYDILWEIFEKVNFEKLSRQQKSMKYYPACKVLSLDMPSFQLILSNLT